MKRILLFTVIIGLVLSWGNAIAAPGLPEFWKVKFENFEQVSDVGPGNDLADGIEDVWGIFKITSIIDRINTDTVWSDGDDGFQITGIFYDIDVDDVTEFAPVFTNVLTSNKIITSKLDIYMQNTGDAGFTDFDPTQGPAGRIGGAGSGDYQTGTDGTLLASLLFKPGILSGTSDAVDTTMTLALNSSTFPVTGHGSGYLDVIPGSGIWADLMNTSDFNTGQGFRDVFLGFDLRDHPDQGMADWSWDFNSEGEVIGTIVPEPLSAALFVAGGAVFGIRRVMQSKKQLK